MNVYSQPQPQPQKMIFNELNLKIVKTIQFIVTLHFKNKNEEKQNK